MTSPHHIGFLLIDDFALMSFASAVEPLRAANILAGRDLYTWSYVSAGKRTIKVSNGLSLAADHTIADSATFDTVLVCAGGDPASFDDKKTFNWLRRMARSGSQIGGVSGGPFILAKAGLLDGFRCTIHWEHRLGMIENFPDIICMKTLFEIDRNRMTCGGGVAALDMMHAIIRRDHGQILAAKVSDWYLQTAVRGGDASQRVSVIERVGTNNRPLVAAIEIMEQRITRPASRRQLATAAKVSVRQLERLFAAHLGVTISRHYVALRMAKARAMLRQTTLAIVQIAAETGFTNASHFAKVYRMHFGATPSMDRSASNRMQR